MTSIDTSAKTPIRFYIKWWKDQCCSCGHCGELLLVFVPGDERFGGHNNGYLLKLELLPDQTAEYEIRRNIGITCGQGYTHRINFRVTETNDAESTSKAPFVDSINNEHVEYVIVSYKDAQKLVNVGRRDPEKQKMKRMRRKERKKMMKEREKTE